MVGYLTESKRKFQNIEEINEKNETRIETSKIEKIHAKKSGDIPAMKWQFVGKKQTNRPSLQTELKSTAPHV